MGLAKTISGLRVSLLASMFCMSSLVQANTAANTNPNIVEQCWQQSETKVLVNECLDAKMRLLEQRVEQAQLEVKALAMELDDGDQNASPTLESFAKAQLAFQVYREQRCQWQSAMFASGSGAGTELLSCSIKVTQQWLEQLNQYQ